MSFKNVKNQKVDQINARRTELGRSVLQKTNAPGSSSSIVYKIFGCYTLECTTAVIKYHSLLLRLSSRLLHTERRRNYKLHTNSYKTTIQDVATMTALKENRLVSDPIMKSTINKRTFTEKVDRS